jgi:hypothetical protein
MVAVIAVLVAMIVYPPFYLVVANGAVLNKGYHWIFRPPDMATVNVSMLLIQWIGVLVVGGIAFFLTKGTSLPSGSSNNNSTVATLPISNIKKVRNREDKDKSKGISRIPLSTLFGGFGAIIGRNVAIIIGFSTPTGASVKVVIFMVIGLAIGSFIGSMIIKSINSKLIARSRGVLLAWGAALVGVVVYFILFAYTQRPQREANNPFAQDNFVTKEPAAPAPAAAPDSNRLSPVDPSQYKARPAGIPPPIPVDINDPSKGFVEYDAGTYIRWGNAYILSGNNLEGCFCLIRACELGDCTGYERSKQNGHCQ